MGRSLLPALSPQPILGFCASDRPFFRFLYLLDAFLGVGDRAFLPRSAPQGLYVGACPGEPAQWGPGEAPDGLLPPSPGVSGSYCHWAAPGILGRACGATSCAPTWPPHSAKACCPPLLPRLPQHSQAAHETDRRGEGMHLGQRAESPSGQLGTPQTTTKHSKPE